MLSSTPIKSGRDAAIYYENLAREDYYKAGGGEPPGQWIGHGAAALGLQGEVRHGQLAQMLAGFHPATGAPIAENAGEEHKPGWDLTFSSPKSVSSLWATASLELRASISAAQARAVAEAVAYIQDCGAASTRHGKGGHEHRPVAGSGGLVAACYEHSTSRNQDPQLHTHVLLANLTPQGRGIDFDTRARAAAGAIYRAELAQAMAELGFQVERQGQFFEISGVPKTLMEIWSTRRAEVEAALAEHGTAGGRAAEIAALDSRNTKADVNRGQLFQSWQQTAAEHGLTPDVIAGLCQHQAIVSAEPPTVEDLFQKMTAQASTFTRWQLEREVFQDFQGVAGASAARQFVTDMLRHPEMILLQDARGELRYTTREMFELERGIIQGAASRQGENRHKIEASKVNQIAEAKGLSPEQRVMLEHVTGADGVACVEGMAGTGKSYALGAAREVWEACGFQVRGAALSGKAAEGLQDGAGIQSQTLHSLIQEIQSGQTILTPRDILVLDEAGMVGSRQMSKIEAVCRQAGAKLVAVGDSRQLQPVDAGGAFRGLVKELGAAELRDIRRQKNEWAKDAVHHLAVGEAGKALQAYHERGLLHAAPTVEAASRQMVTDWREVQRAERQAGETLMLAGTRREVAMLNQIARETLKSDGLLCGPSCRIEGQEFAEGERILFTRNSKHIGVKNGTLGTVQNIEFDRSGQLQISVKTDAGAVVQFTPEKYAHLAHGYCITGHKAQGVTVDHAFIIAGSMADREWSYVAASRSRHETQIYTTTELEATLEKSMARSHLKELSTDFITPDSARHEHEVEVEL